VDLVEADLELFAEEHRLRRIDPLPDFSVGRNEGHRSRRVDLDEGVRHEGLRGIVRQGAAGKPQAEKKTAARQRARPQNGAP